MKTESSRRARHASKLWCLPTELTKTSQGKLAQQPQKFPVLWGTGRYSLGQTATKPLLLLNSGKLQQEQGEDVENDEHGDTNSETENKEKAEYPELKKVAKRVKGK